MFKNQVKIAFRNLIKQKAFSLINLTGLIAGLTSSIFIGLFVIHELTYDRFHEKGDRIYRVIVKGQMMGNIINQAITAAPMAQTMLNDIPEIENVVRIRKYGDWLVRYKDRKFHEENFLFADSTFFEIFDFKLIRGEPHSVLREPKSVVLTESYARKYFGNEDPIGKMLHLETDTTYFTVTGIMEDVPSTSHITFDMVGSLQTYAYREQNFWINHNFYTYIFVKEGVSVNQLEAKLNTLIEKYVGPQIEEVLGINMQEFTESGNTFGYFIQPLYSLHLDSNLQYEFEPNGNKTLVYIFIVVAIMILLVACINFMNLSTARSANRAREVGIKKVVGSSRQYLILQFIFESVFLTFFALIISLLLIELLFPAFNNLVHLKLSLDYFKTWWIIPGLIIFGILVGLFAGSYPAFVLTSFQPAQVMKGTLQSGMSGSTLRRILVVGQFVVSIAILIGTLFTFKQVRYLLNKDVGFDKENVLVIRRSDALEDQIETFKQELKKNPQIIQVTHSASIPGRNFSNNAIFKEGESMANTYLVWQTWVSLDFDKTFSLEMAEGRFFSNDFASDSSGIVLNEAAVKSLGLTDPVGKRMIRPSSPEELDFAPIIGIVKDFTFQTLHEEIHPMGFNLIPGNWEGYIPIKIKGDQVQETVKFIRNTWESFNQDYPFDYFWMEDDFKRQYETEIRTSAILSIFSFLSLLIACLGLFGMVSFSAQKRTKEIGIRKSQGASMPGILVLLSKETVYTMGMAAVLAFPVYFLVGNWLQNFAFHIPFNLLSFLFWLVITVIFVLALSLASVSVITFQAANRNPADSLRYE